MRPHLTLQQYRNLDLFFFTVILIFSESLILLAATRWFPDQLYTVSITGAITAIVMMRWKGFAGIHAVIGGIVICVLLGGSWQQYLIYCVGNLLGLLSLLMIKLFKAERISGSGFATVVFGLVTLVLMQSGRVLVALLLGYEPEACLSFYTTDSLSLVFTAVVMWVAGRLDGIFEDQRAYLNRIHETQGE